MGALVLVSWADRRGLLLAEIPDRETYHLRSARVIRVIDGDTIEIEAPDTRFAEPTTRVRVWGIDSPELARVEGRVSAARSEPFAMEAAHLTSELLHGVTVTLRLEPGRSRGRFGRLLAHVDLPDGTSLAESLLSAGLARADAAEPHALLDRYLQIEWAARRGRVGLWAGAGPDG